MAEATHLPQALGKAMAMLEGILGDQKDQIIEVYEKDGAVKIGVSIDIAESDTDRGMIDVDVGINFIVTRVKCKKSSSVTPGQPDLPLEVNEAEKMGEEF